ncbi:MAG: hypothetical protein ACI8PT_000322 [Gammaproteobacteria bacterium]|jgi:hypothetical protein
MLREVLDTIDLLDDIDNGVAAFLDSLAPGDWTATTDEYSGEKGRTEFVKILFPGRRGKTNGGDARTLGIIGSNGGLRLPTERPGLVSDADGCIVGLSCAQRLARMASRQQILDGDVIVSTHICQRAHPEPHDPYPFVMSPLPSSEKHPRLVDERMEAILTPETCKGNKLVSPPQGFAVTQPVKEGYILRPHESILHLMEMTTGKNPVIFPLNMQDITPYESGVHHVCGMALPSVFSKAPVIGVPLAFEVPIMPAATGTQQPTVLEAAGRFCLEVAGAFGRGDCQFYYESDFEGFVKAYGGIRGWQARY